ncbi:MAG: ion transporter [Methanobacterium sp.]|uniref:potassium channel family protein n=1 Tax=Methanobacterium sp. TaxID=2164 RepID=UPI003D6609EE|nr:ion transporter [Methanobacterium sp.]
MNPKWNRLLKPIWPIDSRIRKILEAIIIILIITDLFLLILITFINIPPQTVSLIIDFDLFVCIVLFFEFVIKIRTEEKKLHYIRKNWIDIVAMIPVDFLILLSADYMGFIRFIRLIRIFRVLVLLKKGQKNILEFLKKTNVVHGAVIFLFIIAAGTVSFFLLEGGINDDVDSYDDALWYVIVTITTVGYGDISPESVGGRMTGAIIMIAGVFLMSILTASLASIMIERDSKEESDKNLEEMKAKMDDMRHEMLSEINELKEIIKKNK